MPEDIKLKGKIKGGKGKGLGKKVGPLPLFVWIGAGVGLAIVAFLYLRRSGQAANAGGPEIVSGSSGSSPEDQASAGAPAGVTPGADMLNPDVLQTIKDQLGSQVGDLAGHITEIEDALGQQGFTKNEDKSWDAPGMDGSGDGSLEDYIRSVVESLGGVQGAPGARGKPGKPGKTVIINKGGKGGKPTHGKGRGKPTHGKPGKPAPHGHSGQPTKPGHKPPVVHKPPVHHKPPKKTLPQHTPARPRGRHR